MVSGPSALLAASLTDVTFASRSVLLSRLFLGRDEPAHRAILLHEVGARHPPDVFRGNSRQLVQYLVVYIGAVDALQEPQQVCLARHAVRRVNELRPRL